MSRAAHADERPRVHIWPCAIGDPVTWSIGPTGARFRSYSPGEALDAALDQLGHPEAVIIFERRL